MQLMNAELGFFPYHSSRSRGAHDLRVRPAAMVTASPARTPLATTANGGRSDRIMPENFTNPAAHARMPGREKSHQQSIA